MTDDTFDDAASPPHPHDFAAQLIHQLYADLDGMLFDGEAGPAENAFQLVTHAAEAARPRGAVLLVVLRGALVAHRKMIFGTAAPAEMLALREASDALASLIPTAIAQLSALQSHALRLTQYLGTAEQSNEPIHQPIARAIQRFYSALAEEDSVTGGRALFELRSLVVHLDAAASALEASGAAPEPLRVIRPDRFHDYFMRYASLAQTSENQSGKAAVATLSQDGRISAVITADTHPLEAAARAVRETIDGDETTRDHAIARIHAVLEFIDRLRHRPQPVIGDPLKDTTIHLSLVIAAATTPLHASGGFDYAILAQVSRYNLGLLRSNQPAAADRH